MSRVNKTRLPRSRTVMQAQSLQTRLLPHAVTQESGVSASASSSAVFCSPARMQASTPSQRSARRQASSQALRIEFALVSCWVFRHVSRVLIAPFLCSVLRPARQVPCTVCKVPDALSEHMLTLGFEDIADFACADASDISKILDEVPAEIWAALGVSDYTHFYFLASGKRWTCPNPYPHRTRGPVRLPRVPASRTPPLQNRMLRQKDYPGELLGPVT